VLAFLLCASIAAGVAEPLGVATTEGATLEGSVSIFAAALAWDDCVACSDALLRASTAFLVFVKTNAPGSPMRGFSSMYSSPNLFVRFSDCMSSASEDSMVDAAESAACAVAVPCEASGSVGASVGLPMRLAVAAAFGASYDGGRYE
jgi:hypothetical protein